MNTKKRLYKGMKNLCGDNIRKYRVAKEMSQCTLTIKCQLEELEIGAGIISRIELGVRAATDYELCVIAHVLGVTINDLMEAPGESKAPGETEEPP